MTKKPIITIVGTTGVGKSQFSIDLAKKFNGEIINADSMQVYKSLNNITNKHPINERQGVPHYVMDHVNWDEEYFIHRFNEEATKAIDDIHARGKIPIIIGGTHYYLQKLLFNHKTIDDKDKRELTKEEVEILDGPVEKIFEELKKYDATISEKFHPQDKRKLRRALEIWYTMGQKPSDLYRDQKVKELQDSSLIYNTLLFWVYSDYEILSKRLDDRVDKMIENGAMEEINELFEFYKQQPEVDITKGVWQVIGFKEFLPYLTSKGTNGEGAQDKLNEGIERMKIRTRQYAKYQVKWIRKLLNTELKKEQRFNYKYGGKMYVLNATDLLQWDNKVENRGFNITDKFLKGEPVKDLEVPLELSSLLNNTEDFQSNKLLDSEKNWKHHICDICKDSNDNNLVIIGEVKWQEHLSSKRHKKGITKRQKMNNLLEYQRKKQQENSKTIQETTESSHDEDSNTDKLLCRSE